ncbi:MAG TPA: DNA gyrase inhibitor YacG [Rhabdaerophilum sp.]|nr:DNA gyrase inhibitor YacG [Rhabdaerophilum sp.]
MKESDPTPIRAPLCPMCGKLRAEAFRPFCSKHCADLDLSRWLKGVYTVPANDEDEGNGHHTEAEPGETLY